MVVRCNIERFNYAYATNRGAALAA